MCDNVIYTYASVIAQARIFMEHDHHLRHKANLLHLIILAGLQLEEITY